MNYYIEYIKICNPKILITFIDNNLIFYKLKKYFPNIYLYRSKMALGQNIF